MSDHVSSESAERHRLENLEKLYHVPVFALRELLRSRVPGRRFRNMRQEELLAQADNESAITEADVDELYENYRYGRRLSFYLYLLPGDLEGLIIEDLQAALDELAAAAHPDLDDEVAASEDYESETLPNQIILLDEEQVKGIREIRFRYYVVHRFLNGDERPDEVLQTRYGFLWLDISLGYLAILSRDERVNHLLTRALSSCLQAIPVPVRFAKELVDKHFSIERAMRLSHYDPGTGIRQSISGHGLWESFEDEILARERRYIRPSSLYEEEVAAGVLSGLGVTASKGKIYFTRTLPTSLVRAWGVRRLPELVRDVRELRESQPEAFSRSTEAINRMRLPAAGKAAIIDIAEGLLQTEREELTSVDLSWTAWDIYDALAGKYFNPYLRTQCSECDEMAELCPHCGSSELELEGQEAVCEECGTEISEGESVILRCLAGHNTSIPLAEAFSIAPNHWLQKRMARIFAEIGQPWREQADYFHIEGRTLHRLSKGDVDNRHLPPLIQNYINHYWDQVAVEGLLADGGLSAIVGRAAKPTRRRYRDFDLRVRGNAQAGYSVEATVTDGGSVPPQPLVYPPDGNFKMRLEGILGQVTSQEDMQAVGEALFCALFPTRIVKLWAAAKGSLEDGDGLRVRLRIDPPDLMSVPWELVFEEEYLGLRPKFPIVRYLELPDPPRPLTVRPPLRVLVAVSQPRDMRQLEVDAELASIHKALDQLADKVEVDVLEAASRAELLSTLRRGYHVLHFVGHGAFDRGRGYLILEDAEQRADRMSASLVGKAVADSNLCLVVLNACDTSVAGREGAFGGVAHQLVKAGMPAVVAMQLAIADRTAVAFSREFYGALADGWPVDAAVQEGRRSIMLALGDQWDRAIDWAIPTLYMRAPDGVILGL